LRIFIAERAVSRLGERWRGVRLTTLVALAGVGDAGVYVTVGCGEHTAVLTREQAGEVSEYCSRSITMALRCPTRRLPAASRTLRLGLLPER
jgi:DMSO/TMAO reductase YedYZ molybdopterin-dependent catalytic subunit